MLSLFGIGLGSVLVGGRRLRRGGRLSSSG